MLKIKLKPGRTVDVFAPEDSAFLTLNAICKGPVNKAYLSWGSEHDSASCLMEPHSTISMGRMDSYNVQFSILKVSPSQIELGIDTDPHVTIFRRKEFNNGQQKA